ncbi:MAG: folylpolyglutamate synthase/dihydrofolate synthase family protein [Oscillospiraceae bacterium]
MFDYIDAICYINSFSKSGKPVSDLTRISKLMDYLGNPQDDLKFVHVAGTNGKGSVIEFCSSILISAGYKVGQFASPYVVCYRDRIRVNNAYIPEKMVMEFAWHIFKKVGKNSEFSQFEITTAIAFMYFACEKCDIVCLETGIGGLLDATNIVKNTLVSVITAISLDHTNILGDTIEKITQQKVGIIKHRSNVVLSADNSPVAIEIVRKEAEKKSSSFKIPQFDRVSDLECGISGSKFSYGGEIYKVSMGGLHQIYNAISAIEAIKILKPLGFDVDVGLIKEGLVKAKVPSRMEIISENPTVILDGAHNPAGTLALADSIKSSNLPHPIVVVAGMLLEKNYTENIKLIKTFAEKVFCVDDFMPNAVPASLLAEEFRANGIDAKILAGTREIPLVIGNSSGTVVVTGSLYLTSETRKLLLKIV